MAGLDLDAVISGGFEVLGRASEGSDQHPHLGGRHLVRRRGVARRWDGGRCERHVLGSPARLGVAGRLPAEVEDLAEDPRAVAVDSVDSAAEVGDPVLIPRLGQDPTADRRGRMHGRGGGDDQPHPGAGSLFLERYVAVGDATSFDHSGAHRRLHDPVGDLDAADGPRRQQVRISLGPRHVCGHPCCVVSSNRRHSMPFSENEMMSVQHRTTTECALPGRRPYSRRPPVRQPAAGNSFPTTADGSRMPRPTPGAARRGRSPTHRRRG